jgi:hypothetical protein
MFKQFWHRFIRVPPGLDLAEKFYLYGQYAICVLLALNAPIFVVGAVFSDKEVLVRLALIAAAIAVVAFALGLRVLVFWIYLKKIQISKHLGL